MVWPQKTNGVLTSVGLSVSTPWASGSKRRVDHAGGLEGKELLVADGSCPHIRELLATCRVPVLWLTGQQDPLIVVGRALAQRRAEGTPVQTLHWVSHGALGAVFVGPKKINTTALLNAQQELAAWQLKTINLWSCSTGADQDFVSVLEELSGASVWASPGTLGRQADGSSHWQLTKPSKNKRPDLPINKRQKLAWNYSLVAGADFEGPQSLSGTVATGRAWFSLEETISSGERLLLNQDFFGSVFAAMGDGDTVHIGVKSSTWASSDNPFTADSAAGFAGNFAIRLTTQRSGQWAGTKRSSIYKDGAEVARSYGSSRGTTWSPQYFLELSHDGDNVRIAQSRSSSSERALHISTTPYSWWDVDGITTNKDQTGDQNFNFTSTDILLHWSGWDANSTFDYATVDWSELTETAVPTDETAPIFSSAATSTDGTKVVLTYNEALSVTTPYGDSAVTWSRFTVTTDGDANAVTGVSVSGATVELTLTNTVKNDQTVTVAYTDSTNDNDYIAIQDLGGCDAASLSSTAAINKSSIAGTPPTIAISSDVASLKAGETASLSFALSEASSDFVQSDVTFSGGALSNWNAASATSYSATFTPTADSTTNAMVSVASSKFSDAAGNTNNDGSDDNNTVTLSVDTVRPTIAISSDVASLKAGETASLSFALSEASSDFVQSDVTFSGGALSNWNAASATSYSATFTPTADSTTNAMVSVASSKFSDAAGNTNNDGSDDNNTVTLSVDTVRPTIAVSSDVASLKAGETASLSFALSEASSNFAESDVTFSGGALSNWNAASATSYSATFTPTADSTTNAMVSVASSKFSDAAGNTNNDGSQSNNSVTLSVDTIRPTIAVSSDVASLKAGETASLSFALSEASSNFAESDVTFSGGALSNWNAASATSYSATFTPTADSTTNAMVSVASSKFSDAAGNTNNDGSQSNNSVTLSVDTIRPTIAISSDVASLKAVETASLSFALSEASSDFVQSDVTFSGGALSNWNAASATSYSATFTPTADSTTNAVVSVASAKFSDSAGNTNNDGSQSNNSVTLSVDTVRPTIAISSDVASLKAGETASLGFTLSESTTDFVQSDVSVSGGALSNFSGSGTAYSSTFTPAANSTSDGLISVASAKFSDSAGNTNNDGSQSNNSVTLSVDTVRPSFSSAATSTDGAKVVLSYDETLSSSTAPTSAFAVTTDGAANAVTAVSNDGATSELTLTNTIKANQAVTVAYNDPSSSDDANALQDSAGNDAVSFSSTSVTNNSTIPAASTGGSDLIPNTPTTSKLLLSNDNSFSVTKSAAQGLWINLKVISADSDLQNSLIIVDQNNNALGCIGATHSSGNCGDHAIFMPHGSTISFHQFSNNQPLISSPQLDITDNNDGSFQLRLNDRLNDSDHDDLVVDISHSASSPNPAATAMAAKQQGIHNAVLDLSSIPATGQTLKLSLNSNCAFVNRIAMVKLSEDADGNFSVDGITNTAGAAFDQAVADNLINPGGDSISCTGVETQAIEWDLSASDAGLYAPVLITPDGEIYTYGSSQIKALGCNFFAFEDDNSQNSSDWDFNDLSIKFEII